jgi:glycosyltransferase involved in cell wall biosynthesis
MTRILFVTGSLVHGGAERHSITVMNRLAERGYECHAVYVKNDPSQLERIRLRGGGTVRCLEAARYFDGRAVADFARHAAWIRPSVVVAANPYALMYSSLAVRSARLPAPVAVTFHSTRLQGAKEQLKMAFERPFFWTADCLIFVCEKQKRHWLRRGVLARRNEVIHNGVDTAEFCDAWNETPRAQIRRAYGFTDAHYVIGMSAVLRREKNPVQLVEAVARLRRMGVPARALMIGDGEMRPAVEERARRLNIESHILITGLQAEVRPCIAACDAMVLCSFTEAFSLAAIESMALHKPVVHSDVGGASEMIVPGWNGSLFPVGDTDALVEQLRLLSDRAVSRTMGNNARAMVEARFSEDTMVERYEQTVLELARARAGARLATVRSGRLITEPRSVRGLHKE